jgi:hypothetical protein
MNNQKPERFATLVESTLVEGFNKLNPIKYICPTHMMSTPIGMLTYIDYVEVKKQPPEMTELKLVVKNHTVETKEHVVNFKVPVEAQMNLKEFGIDFDLEMFQQVVNEFSNGMIVDFYNKVKNHALTHYESSLKWYHKIWRRIFKNYKKRIRINDIHDLTKLIAKKSNGIYIKTRRGPADYIITTPRMSAYLADSPNYMYTKSNGMISPSTHFYSDGSLKVGNRDIPIYTHSIQDGLKDYIILGKTGNKKEIGVGLALYDNIRCVKSISEDYFNKEYSILSRSVITDIGEKGAIDSMFSIEYVKLKNF